MYLVCRRPLARTVIRGVRCLAVLVLGVVLVTGVLRGGARYLFCPMLDAVVDAACCTSAHEASDAVQEPDCCQARRIGSLPSAQSSAPAPQVAAAPLLAFLPASYARGPGHTIAHERFDREPTGPPPRSGVQRAAHLMVFLI